MAIGKAARSLWLAGLAALSLTPAAPAAAAQRVVGYRGDGNGFYADADPPVTWNDLTGENIAWRTRLPNWCLGQPLVVGERVFVMSEPGWKSDFPALVCIDGRSGNLLWQKEINHLSAAVPDEAKRKEIAAAWHNYLERYRAEFRMFYEIKNTKDDGVKKQLTEQARALGWMGKSADGFFADRYSGGGYGVLRSVGGPGLAPDYQKYERELPAYGLRFETFYRFGISREGEAFPTPASDGKFVYVVTEQGSHACFDMDGNLRWLNWIKPTFNPGGHDDSICRSPVVVDGLFITDLHVDRDTKNRATGERANPVNALCTDTGAVAWQTRLPVEGGREQNYSSSKVIDVGGNRYFITSQGHILRIKDGRSMFTCPGDLLDPTEVAVDDANDTIFVSPGAHTGGKQLVALQLKVDGDKMEAKERWRTAMAKSLQHTTAVADGKLYTGPDVVDLATGTAAPLGKERGLPTRWLVAVAGGRLYGLSEGRGDKKVTGDHFAVATGHVFDLSGKRLASNILLTPIAGTKEMQDQRVETTGRATLPGEFNSELGWTFSYSCPFTFAGDSMYVRSNDELICIRNGGGAGPRNALRQNKTLPKQSL
jgi:outer membrane protein assembly factor BamB